MWVNAGFIKNFNIARKFSLSNLSLILVMLAFVLNPSSNLYNDRIRPNILYKLTSTKQTMTMLWRQVVVWKY